MADTSLNTLDALALSLKQQLPRDIPVYCSPLQRCRQLADKLHPQPIPDERLMEMHFGQWETRAWSDIPRAQLDQWAEDPLHYTIPGGESVAHLQERVLQFVREKHAQGIECLVLVTHAGVMKILAGAARQLSFAEWMALGFDYGSLETLDWN